MNLNLREAIAATSLANLGWDENREKAIDRVAACGKATPLGVAIIKAKYMNESQALREATKLLSKWFMEKYTGEQAWLSEKVCEQALYECVFCFCANCLGAGEVVSEDLKVTCPVCAGAKVQRHSNEDRCHRMKISWGLTKALKYKIGRTVGKCFDEEGLANYQLNIELGRHD